MAKLVHASFRARVPKTVKRPEAHCALNSPFLL